MGFVSKFVFGGFWFFVGFFSREVFRFKGVYGSVVIGIIGIREKSKERG